MQFLSSYPSAKIVFSVIPKIAVAQADTKINRPKKVCIGKYELLRCEARPGNRKVMTPASHWKLIRKSNK